MRTLLVSDIFGKTASLKTLAGAVSENVEIIDPYAGPALSFADEAQAYAYFMKNGGVERYCQIVDRHVAAVSQPTGIVGFSVGASAVWILSERLNPLVFQRVVCFYGSQIRTHKHIKPCVRVDLVLPKWEPTFDVEKLARELSTKPNVKIHRTPYMHGFMNHLSKNFSAMAYETYIAWLKGALPHRSSGTGKP